MHEYMSNFRNFVCIELFDLELFNFHTVFSQNLFFRLDIYRRRAVSVNACSCKSDCAVSRIGEFPLNFYLPKRDFFSRTRYFP